MNAIQRKHEAIERLLRPAMTVADLIKHLQKFDDDAVVVFASDYGDHCHTTQALPVSRVNDLDEEGALCETAYSHSGMRIDKFDENADPVYDEVDESGLPFVVVLH